MKADNTVWIVSTPYTREQDRKEILEPHTREMIERFPPLPCDDFYGAEKVMKFMAKTLRSNGDRE